MRYIVSLIDSPIELSSGKTFCGNEVILQGPQYGRFLFTDNVALMVKLPAKDVTICHNLIRCI